MRMKLVAFMSTLLLLLLFSTACESDQPEWSDDYYWLSGEKKPVQRMTGKFYVAFNSGDEEKLTAELAKNGVSLTNVEEWLKKPSYGIDFTDAGLQLLQDYKTATIEADYGKIKSALSHTLKWSPYYKRMDDGRELRLEFLFYVQLKPNTNKAQLETLAKENAVIVIGADKFMDGWYYLTCTNSSKGNTLEMANFFYESGLFANASPSWGNNGSID